MKRARNSRKKKAARKQLNYLRARLMEKRRELLAQMQTGHGSMAGAVPGDDVLDRAQDAQGLETFFQTAEIESAAVEQIDDAIQRIECGTYGVCEMCHEPIPVGRLKALPSARLCARCQGRLESEQGGPAGHGPSRFEDVSDESFDPERVHGSVRGRRIG